MADEHPILSRYLGIRSWAEARKAIAALIASLVFGPAAAVAQSNPVTWWDWLAPVTLTLVVFLVGNDQPVPTLPDPHE